MPDEVVPVHSNILAAQHEAKPPTYNEVSNLLLTHLRLKMSEANVRLLCEVLVSARRNEANRPNRPGLTKQITRVRDATRVVQRALVSEPVLNRLRAGDPSFLAKWPDYWACVTDIDRTTEAGLATIPKKGRARSATPEEISPRANCSLLVTELFGLSGHEHPRPTNTKAQTIAEALWRASGGPPWTGHAKNLASWRPYFREMTRASEGYRQALRSLVQMRLGTELPAGEALSVP